MIPDGVIEHARQYSLLPKKGKKPIGIGGAIMMNLVVRDQMNIDNIIAQTGTKNNNCMIFVDYTETEILEFIDNAKKRLARMRGGE